MGTELRPLNVSCNIRCHYCYQNPQRDAAEKAGQYDMAAMKAAVEQEGKSFTLFGGEPLLVPERDLAELWSWGQIKFGGNGIQTNGSLINERHITMFKKYRVSVGISIDGPGELNDVRWAGSLEATRRTTARTEHAIRRLCEEKIYPSLIVTLHRGNAIGERLPILVEWLRSLEATGVRSVRLHILEVDSSAVRDQFMLTDDENIKAFLYFAEAETTFKKTKFDVFEDIRKLLLGKDNSTTCIWNACDQYTTSAVRGVEGNGQKSNCGRTNKDGIDYVKGATPGYERYVALYETPYERGGCSGCRFFLMCKGQCPGTAINHDWRNRSEHCRVWMALFEHFEHKLLTSGGKPLSTSTLRPALESKLVTLWASGKNSTLQGLLGPMESASQASGTAPIHEAPPDRIGSHRREFTRSVWVSDRACTEWEGKIKAIAATWRRLEWKTVVKGVRESALLWVSESELSSLQIALRDFGLKTSVLQAVEHRNPQAEAGILFRVAIGTSGTRKKIRAAWIKRDSDRLGELLGYPKCCRAAFDSEYLKTGHQDSIWPAALAGNALPGTRTSLDVKGPPQLNMLLARIGVRLVPHLPCSFTCEESLRLAHRFQDAADIPEDVQAIGTAFDMLSWPMAWSATNGIAEVKTPVIKIDYGTDPAPEKRFVQYLGKAYPNIGARGLQFPFQILQ